LCLDEEIRTNRDFLSSCLKDNLELIHILPQKLDKSQVFHLISETKQDIFDLLLRNADYFSFLHTELLRDFEFILKCVKANPKIFPYLPSLYKNNHRILESMISYNEADNTWTTQYLEEILLGFKHEIPAYETALKIGKISGKILEKIPHHTEWYRSFVDFLLEVNIKNIQYVPRFLRKDADFMRKVIEKDGLAFLYADINLQMKFEFALLAVENNGMALQYIPKEISLYKYIVKKALEQNGRSLQYASEEIQDNEKAVLIACKQDGTAFEFASLRLRDSEEYIQFLLEETKDSFILLFVSDRLFEKPGFQFQRDMLSSSENVA
jgi:hypothetical protein